MDVPHWAVPWAVPDSDGTFSITPPASVDNYIIYEFLLLRRARNSGIPAESLLSDGEISPNFSESVSLSQCSKFSLRRSARDSIEATPDTDIEPDWQDQFTRHHGLHIDATSMPFHIPLLPSLRTSLNSLNLARHRQLMADLEFLQGIHVASFAEIESEFDDDSYSFAELVYGGDLRISSTRLQDLVLWLAAHFQRRRRERNHSIDGLVMSNDSNRLRMNWRPSRRQETPRRSNYRNVFSRIFGHRGASGRNEFRSSATQNRRAGNQFYSFF